ncbi:MAG: L-threonylcarbamoyladenylate synthase [Candidatus Promineifilaceae bacterium]|nr:L-threonylcarbamoyladenylate synthase [Candidatus Promineifilaceae bacterium]
MKQPHPTTTRLLTASDPRAVQETAAAILKGDLVVFPTDTLYGVGTNAFDQEAIMRLYAAKERPLDKGIPILLADLVGVEKVAVSIPAIASKLIAKFWPGPLTLILPKRSDLPNSISMNESVAVRIPDSKVARAVIRAAGGAVATSSANRSGSRAAQTAEQALQDLGGRVSIVLDAGPTGQSVPSTIIDCSGETIRILRQGPIKLHDLRAVDAGYQWATS